MAVCVNRDLSELPNTRAKNTATPKAATQITVRYLFMFARFESNGNGLARGCDLPGGRVKFRRASLFYVGMGSHRISTFDWREKLPDYDLRNNR